MMLFGYRLPMMSSLLVWCLIWEIVGQLDLMFLIPPLSSVVVAMVELVQTKQFLAATVVTLRSFVVGMVLVQMLGSDGRCGTLPERLDRCHRPPGQLLGGVSDRGVGGADRGGGQGAGADL